MNISRIRKTLHRTLFIGIIFILIAFYLLWVAAGPLVKAVVPGQLQKVFQADDVAILDCQFDYLYAFRCSDLSIKKGDQIDLAIDDIQIMFSLSSLLKKNIPMVIVEGVRLTLDLQSGDVPILVPPQKDRKARKLTFGDLIITQAKLDVKWEDVAFVGEGAVTFDINRKEIKSVDMLIASAKIKMVQLKGGAFVLRDKSRTGKLWLESVAANRIKIENITAQLSLVGRDLMVESLNGSLLNGFIRGQAKVVLSASPEYAAKLNFNDLGIARFIQDFNLGEKVDMTGKMAGELTIKGKLADISRLRGVFAMDPVGGLLIIKDMRFLENMARQTNQPLDIVVDSFKRYRYNTGSIQLSLENDNLVADMALGGEAGKRKISIVLHDFMSLKPGQ